MLALVGIASSQLLFGPSGSTVVLTMPCNEQRSFAVLMLMGAGFVLLGAILPEPRAYWVELGGCIGCAVVLFVYTLTLKSTVGPDWNTSMGSGFAFIGAGCVLRAGWLVILIAANFYPRVFARFHP
jgi:hypothetical protein